MSVCLVTALCDPPGELLAKAEQHWPALTARFPAIAIHVTTDTHPDWLAFLAERKIPTASADPNWDHIGLHRRRSLALGLGHSTSEHLLYVDPDHILRWVERKPEELDAVLSEIPHSDCLVIGRGTASFDVLPQRLKDTELIVNRIYRLISGRPWDVMMAARAFSRRAATLIVAQCSEDTLGNDVAWPLLVQREGLSLSYIEADGLTYETNRVYAEDGQDSEDDDPAAWMLRVYTANQHVDAMRPFLNPPDLAGQSSSSS